MSSAKKEEEDEEKEKDKEEDEDGDEEVRSEKLHFLLKSCRRLTAAPASAAGEENWPRQFNFTLNFQHRHTSAHLTESGQRDGLAVAPVRVLLRHLQPRPRLLRPSSE